MVRGLCKKLAVTALAALPGLPFCRRGAVYQVVCGLDYSGPDIKATQTPTFAGCINACDATPGCVDVSYLGESCYVKSKAENPAERDWVWSARLVTPATGSEADKKLSCVDKKSDKTTYTTTSGTAFQVLCGIDYSGTDVGATNTPTFEQCIEACASTSGCIDVSYVGEACYMKSKVETALERDWVWSAKIVESGSGETSTKLSCDDNASDGKIFQATTNSFEITCGKDYAGGDLLGTSAASFEECIQACDSNAECLNVAYIHGACYLKKEQNPAVDNTAVWGAIRKSTATATTTTATTSSAISTPTKGPLSCENNASNRVKFTSAKGGLYQVLCGVDFGGNDLAATTAASFEDCIAACDENKECVDVSFVAPSCYLKSAATEMSQVGHVWTAKQLKAPGSAFVFPTATPMDIGSGTEENFEPIELPAAPIATLGPVPPPGVNMGGTRVLTPEPVAELWYNGTQKDNDDEAGEPVTVRLNITYSHPSIVLDHSIYIKDVVCDAGSLHGRFNTSYPFYFAQDSWQTDEDVLLITSAPSCGNDAAQNAFFLAHTVSFEELTLSFEALGQIVQLADVFADMTIDFGNITVTEQPEEQEDVCGSPSADNLLGLPAVSCGTNFDKTLDDKLGYYSANGADLETVLTLASPINDKIQTRGLGDALRWVGNTIKKGVDVVVGVAKNVGNAIVDGAKALGKAVVNTAKSMAKAAVALATHAIKLVGFIATGKYENSLTLPVNVGPPSNVLVDSPFGKAFKMYTFKMGEDNEKFSATRTILENMRDDFLGEPNPEPGVEIYCVNCGARGSVKATGRIHATLVSGIQEASIGISGNMYIGLYLGINGFAKWEKEWEKEIFKRGLPGWSIPGIVTLGPEISLAGKFMIGFEAEGQVLTGASVNFPAFEANLDLRNPSKSNQKGWVPNVDHVFQVHGGVKATAALGLPVKLFFGVDILNGVFKEGISLVDTPALTGTAEFEVNVGTDETSVGTDECKGIEWEIALTNEVTLEVEKGPEWTLAEWSSPALAEGCIGYTPGGGDDGGDGGDNGGGNGGGPPVIPDLPGGPVDDGNVKCPGAWNGQTYTDAKGNQWSIRCNYDYVGNVIAQTKVQSMNECMDWCATQPNCAVASFGMTTLIGPNCQARSRAVAGRIAPLHSMTLLNPFEIVSAIYGTVDITGYAVSQWQVGNRLEINTNIIAEQTEPRLIGTPKSIFMLYRYGLETRTWVGAQNSGIRTIYPGPVAGPSMLVPDWPQPSLPLGPIRLKPYMRIIDICYGQSQIRDRNIWNMLYMKARTSAEIGIENELFADTWFGITKSAVIWYKDITGGEDGPMYIVTGIEHDLFKLMDPPPASWTNPWGKRDVLALPRQAGEGTNSTLPSNTTTTAAEPGQGIATVRDFTGAIELLPSTNGNLFISPVDSTEDLSLLTNSVKLAATTLPDNKDMPYLVNSDSTERLLHYFPDEIASVGASRLRLATWDKLPVGSRMINLAPITSDSDTEGPLLLGVTLTGDLLFPVVCGIDGQLNKVFLAKDNSEATLKALEAEDLKFVLTGGQASECFPLALTAMVEVVA
ncbi:hypothetical protein N0V88_003357 [Collariella sp. IMI 366227]|nr:hypothetical protein N0V88_003357 [Collariella sp. IMI 366227]